LIIRQLSEKDCEPFKGLFEEAYTEYLFLRLTSPKQYHKEKRKVTQARFNFYQKPGSGFMVKEKDEVISYVATQTVSYHKTP